MAVAWLGGGGGGGGVQLGSLLLRTNKKKHLGFGGSFRLIPLSWILL